jgi:2-methylcitrate dehydratase PrpD
VENNHFGANGVDGANAKIAEFTAGFSPDRLSQYHFHQTARAIVDTFACAIAGRNEAAATIALDYARERSASRMATAWGSRFQLPAEDAALYNGIVGHVLDFDDVTGVLRGHPSIGLLPALIALGEVNDKSGKQLAAAFVAGFEVVCKLARAIVSDHYAKGWHATATVGTIGATVACANLLGLDRNQTSNALGIAVAQAAGSRSNFGTMTKSFQAGHCGASAVRAVLLAQRGFTGARDALGGAYGYMALYANGEDLHAQLDTLGNGRLEVEAAGFEIKKYPMCYATHHTIDGVLDLRAEHDLKKPDEVERVEIVVSNRGLAPLLHSRPQTGLEAKFSMEYAVAAALHDGHVRLASFEDTAVRRAGIQQFFPRVVATEDAGPVAPRWSRMRIMTRDGRTLEKTVTRLRGGAECPLTDAELIEKAADCFAFGGYEASAQVFADAAFSIERLQVSEMMAAA